MSGAITKLSLVKGAAANGNWQKAILLAAKFPDLGKQRDAILSAREAINRPAFQIELKRDPQALIAAGVDALKTRYRIA